MEYTVAFIFYHDLKEVILIHKDHGPDPGKLNGLGGAIEEWDACPSAGALREIREESGITEAQLSQFEWLETVLKPNGNSVWYYYGVLKPGEDFVQPDSSEILHRIPVSEMIDVTDSRFAGRGDVCLYVQSALFELGLATEDPEPLEETGFALSFGGIGPAPQDSRPIDCPHRVQCQEGPTCCAHLAEDRIFECRALTQGDYDALEYKCDYQYTQKAGA